MEKCCAILLAGGRDAGASSDGPTVLWEVLFRPMLGWAVDACRKAGFGRIFVAAGAGEEPLRAALDESIPLISRLGLPGGGPEPGDVLVLRGDAPLLDAATIEAAYRLHREGGYAATLITARLADPVGYARVIRGPGGVERIVPERDATPDERAVCEVFAGGCWFRGRDLAEAPPDPGLANWDFGLAEAAARLREKGRSVGAFPTENPDAALRAAGRAELLRLNQRANRRIAEALMEQGVEFLSLDGVLLSPDCRVGRGTRILPGVELRPGTVIGADCVIGPNSLISRSTLGDRTVFNSSQCWQSEIGADVSIGPFCHIRPHSRICGGVHIGDFVEIKNSVIGEQTHVSHLTYVGDSDVGRAVNFGCGVATANYNGVSKARCTIGDHAFIGCNTNLVAPVVVGPNGYTAAGSTITDDVPAEALAIARARQVNKEGYNNRIRK